MVPLVTLVETLAHLAPWSRGWSTSPMRTGVHPAHPSSRPSLRLLASPIQKLPLSNESPIPTEGPAPVWETIGMGIGMPISRPFFGS